MQNSLFKRYFSCLNKKKSFTNTNTEFQIWCHVQTHLNLTSYSSLYRFVFLIKFNYYLNVDSFKIKCFLCWRNRIKIRFTFWCSSLACFECNTGTIQLVFSLHSPFVQTQFKSLMIELILIQRHPLPMMNFLEWY